MGCSAFPGAGRLEPSEQRIGLGRENPLDSRTFKRLHGPDLFGVRLIGAGKVVSGLVSLLVGALIFGHLDFNLAQWVTHTGKVLRLAPGNRVLHELIEAAAGVHERHLRALGIAAFLYALLHLVEGIGLMLERRWAGRLTVVATGALIPLELFELVRHVTAVRLSVVTINAAILIYVAVKLRREQDAWVRPGTCDLDLQKQPGPAGPPA